ncbi:MAG: hypothetical protein N2169_03115 [bacterium]|nr:hypothetical protein [bacterium]
MRYIGIVRLDRIGDTILTLPAIKMVRNKYSDYKIVGILNEYNSQLFLYNSQIIHPYFDIIEILPINLYYGKVSGFSVFIDIYNYLRVMFWKNKKKYRFEKVFVFSPTTVSYLLGRSLRANRKYTYFYATRFNKSFFSRSFIHYVDNVDKSVIDDYSSVRHEIFQNLDVVRLDFDLELMDLISYRPEIFLPDIPFERYDLLIFDKELFFVDNAGKNWIRDFVNTIFDECKRKAGENLKVGFVSRRKQEFEFALNPNVIELMGLIKNCKCVICFDSGILHMASAFNTNVVAIFANRYFDFDTKRWAPLSDNKKIVKLDIFNDEHVGDLDFELTNPLEFAKYVFYQAQEYL